MTHDLSTPDLTDLIFDALIQPGPGIGYYLSRKLSSLFPEKAFLEGGMPQFDPEGFSRDGHCLARERPVPHSERLTYWQGSDQPHLTRAHNTLLDVSWEDHSFHVLISHWPGDMGTYHYTIIGETQGALESFHGAVCEWAAHVEDDELLVFDVNGWNRDAALFYAIKSATLDNLVLRGTLKQDILNDISSFFEREATYKEYGVPWKRGILFVGPAGNGKTHAVKALVSRLEKRCLYVKTFGPGGGPDPMAIRAVFDRARAEAPCIVVLEDLDSLVTQFNRSYLLNELDGFAGNDGILVLATTNHPDALDPAILDRPSRFDRKYPFDLPGLEERTTYVRRWCASVRPALQLSEDGIGQVATQTEGFSFAYLKELFLAATMRWIDLDGKETIDTVCSGQAEMLKGQMASLVELPSDPGYGMAPQAPVGPYGRHRRRYPPGMHGSPGPGDVPM